MSIPDDFGARMADILSEILARDIQQFAGAIENLCDSPIEAMLGAAIFYTHRITHRGAVILICSKKDSPKSTKEQTFLIPQYPFKKYRIDWLLRYRGQEVFVECDGHDFHERTKEQAARDRSKDRALQLDGFPILRFTGSEIYRDPIGCAAEIFSFAHAREG